MSGNGSRDTWRARPARHAGTWYPGGAESLARELDELLQEATPRETPQQPLLGLIAPHAGLRYSGGVAAQAFARLDPESTRRVFLLGPSHYNRFNGVAVPPAELGAYRTPLGDLQIDAAATARLRGRAGFDGPGAAHDPEHSLEMQAIFLAHRVPEALLVPLLVGQLGDDRAVARLAQDLRPLLAPGDVVVVSSDFTHYGSRFGYLPFRHDVPAGLERLMDAAASALEQRDLQRFSAHCAETGDTICGREPIRLLLALLPDRARGRELGRETSGHLTGDYANSVSYLAFDFCGPPWSGGGRGGASPEAGATAAADSTGEFLGAAARSTALAIARRSLETYLGAGGVADAAALAVPADGPLRAQRAAFVTLHQGGRLRGCIGHIFPVQALWRDIRDNAIAAATRDHRFAPVQQQDLAEIEIEVSVLTPPRPVAGPEAFEAGRHGVVLKVQGRSAVFLPQVARDQGWDRETTLSHLALKAGLPATGWRHPEAELSVFEAQVFGEPAPSA